LADNTAAYTEIDNATPLDLVVNAVQECERRYHDVMVRKIERRYAAYRGISDPVTENQQKAPASEDWHSNITTPYVLNTCEGMLATMLEPNPRFNVQPRPHPDESLDEVIKRISSVDAIDAILRYALDRARFSRHQRDFMQQDLIAGITVLKTMWRTEKRTVTQLVPETIEILDASGQTVDQMQSHTEDTVDDATIFDDADVEVRDVRDFFWPSQASSIEKAEYLIDRTWESFEQLKRLEAQGIYKNVDDVKFSQSNATSASSQTQREMTLRNIDRTRNLHEVLEYWTPERLITVADRKVVLRDVPNPLWNGRMPFIVCAAMPDGFQVAGISVVEALAQLQSMLWTLQNQRIDVLRLLANNITLIRADVDDLDGFEWAPNAQWIVEDPAQVEQLRIDPTAAQITLQAESLLKGDLQNIMGGLPYNSGVNSDPIQQDTATGMSIITTIAQRIIQSRKQHYMWAYAELARHFLLLYQQFLRDDRVVPIVGAAGAIAYREVTPLELQGDYEITIDVTSDSLMRQERRSEKQSLLQVAASVQQIFLMTGTPLNLKAFMEGTLDAFDIQDKERYFMPPQAVPAMTQQSQQQGAPGRQGGGQQQQDPSGQTSIGGGGTTNVDLAAGPMGPNSTTPMGPSSAMAQMMRMQGGPSNAPG
jgi:hypothetical protein